MKKEITTVKYYCDFCGEECDHTPEYVLPQMMQESVDSVDDVGFENTDFRRLNSYYEHRVKKTQKDICHDCARKIAMLLPLVENMTIQDNGTWKMALNP